jgi:hypothetical protein
MILSVVDKMPEKAKKDLNADGQDPSFAAIGAHQLAAASFFTTSLPL